MGIISCCKDCTKRELGCHSNCELYISQKKEQREVNRRREEYYEKHHPKQHISYRRLYGHE